MRCTNCYYHKRKDKQKNEYPQMIPKGEYLVCSLCGYRLVQDKYLKLRQFVYSKEKSIKLCAELH